MANKKLIITNRQFNHLNEVEQNSNFNLTANIGTGGVPEINKALDSPELHKAIQMTGIEPKFIPQTYKGPKSSATVEVQADGAGDVNSLPPGTPADAAIVVKQANGTVSESYTKKKIEEMRVAKIMKSGKHFKKKNLFEGDLDDYIDKSELAQWCLENDFLYYFPNNIFGDRISCANSSEIQKEIADDIMNCAYLKAVENETDPAYRMFASRHSAEMENAVVVRLCDIPSEHDYYVLWERDDA